MKWLILPLLWLFAVALAVAVLWRLWRGQNVVLHGRWGPRVVRMVAVILVVLGVGVEKGRTAPIPQAPSKERNDEPLPASVTENLVERWEKLQALGPYVAFKKGFAQMQLTRPTADGIAAKKREWDGALPSKLRRLVEADLDALVAGKPAPPLAPAEAVRILDEAERSAAFDHWLCAYLWRRTAEGPDRAEAGALVELYSRLSRHARLTNALIRIRFGKLSFDQAPDVWRGKGGGFRKNPFPFPGALPGGGRGQDHFVPEATLAAMHRAGVLGKVDAPTLQSFYAVSDTGTWARDGVVRLTVAEGSAAPGLVRGGNRWLPRPGQAVRLERLDLIDTPAGAPVLLEHEWLGRIELPADRLVSVWDLPGLLPAAAREKVEASVRYALANNHDGEVRQLERALPLVHGALRAALQSDGHKPGAARLRLILALFDDAVTPAAPEPALIRGPDLIANPEEMGRRVRRGAEPPPRRR